MKMKKIHRMIDREYVRFISKIKIDEWLISVSERIAGSQCCIYKKDNGEVEYEVPKVPYEDEEIKEFIESRIDKIKKADIKNVKIFGDYIPKGEVFYPSYMRGKLFIYNYLDMDTNLLHNTILDDTKKSIDIDDIVYINHIEMNIIPNLDNIRHLIMKREDKLNRGIEGYVVSFVNKETKENILFKLDKFDSLNLGTFEEKNEIDSGSIEATIDKDITDVINTLINDGTIQVGDFKDENKILLTELVYIFYKSIIGVRYSDDTKEKIYNKIEEKCKER